MGEGKEEHTIVTSTGRYVVAWDFGKVKKNKLDSYVIKRYVGNFLTWYRLSKLAQIRG